MKRLYDSIVKRHLDQNEQMLFLSGPRQVGKTTIAQTAKQYTNNYLYLNWDNEKLRQIILSGEDEICRQLNVHTLTDQPAILVLDELHKFKDWKNFLKGFYDVYKGKIKIIVTGSAKLNIYKAGGDSLMGRYLFYRVHPLSLAELIHPMVSADLITPPKKSQPNQLQNLVKFGGYPEPFIKNDELFANQWQRLRTQQLIKEEIRELSNIQDIAYLEMLATLLKKQVGTTLNYTNLSRAIRVSVDTVRRWIDVLELFYYSFRVKPWFKNVKRSLLKEPKVYLWNWAEISDPGARYENLIACHLHKAVNLWTDYGFGEFGLYFLRDKDQHEVDFLVTRDQKPWFIVEVKASSKQPLNKNLMYFQQQINALHVFQVVFDLPFVDIDCFTQHQPIIVPADVLLSQLV